MSSEMKEIIIKMILMKYLIIVNIVIIICTRIRVNIKYNKVILIKKMKLLINKIFHNIQLKVLKWPKKSETI
jgi:hypothetical protein